MASSLLSRFSERAAKGWFERLNAKTKDTMVNSISPLTSPTNKLKDACSLTIWKNKAEKVLPHSFFRKVLTTPKETAVLRIFQNLTRKEEKALFAYSWGAFKIHLIHLAASLNYNHLLKAILDSSPESGGMEYWFNLSDYHGNRALHHCALVGNRIGIDLLLRRGDRDTPNRNGATATMLTQLLSAPERIVSVKPPLPEEVGGGLKATASCSTVSLSELPCTGSGTSFVPIKHSPDDLDEDSIEIKTEGGFNRIKASEFAGLKGIRSFLVTRHRAEHLNLLKTYYESIPLRSSLLSPLEKELLISQLPLTDTYIDHDAVIGHGLFAKKAFALGDPIVQWFGEIVPDLFAHLLEMGTPDSEYSMNQFYNERDYSPACLIMDGFPNLLMICLTGVSGAPRDYFGYAMQPIAQGERLKWNYGSSHKVKFGPHVEHDLPAILAFLKSQMAENESTKQVDRLGVAFQKAHMKYKEHLIGDYISTIEKRANNAFASQYYNMDEKGCSRASHVY